MAKVCTECGRGSAKAMHRSHSKIATPRRQFLNLQTRRVAGKKVKVCTSCLRTANKKATA